jgi:tetratricopeptide (TPR) repeat protein
MIPPPPPSFSLRPLGAAVCVSAFPHASRTPAIVRLARSHFLSLMACCFLLLTVGTVFDAVPVAAQAPEQTESLGDEVRDRLAEGRRAVRDLLGRPATGPILVGLLAVWVVWYVPRLLRRSAGHGGPSRGLARRLARRGDYLEAGRIYEKLGDWEAAAETYEQGRAFGEAARSWEHQNQPAKAARLYEQANEYLKAGELYARVGNHLRAATLFQKGGRDVQAAEAAERAGDLERAASLYVKFDAFERAGDLRFQMRQYAQAAELLERALGRLRRGPQESAVSASAGQALVRRCAEAYAKADQPTRAGAVLRDHGMEVEAAEQYCQAGEWDTGLGLFIRHQQFDREAQLCEELGRTAELHVVLGERFLVEGREEDAAHEFEAGGLWWRAGEMYQRIRDHGKAAEMYARHGDEERAAEMYVAAADPRRAAIAFERLGKRHEAAQYYQQAGDRREAARVLQEAEDYFGAARELLAAGASEDAMALLQHVGPESERYLDASVLLGDLFLERSLDGPAREKYERAVALRASGPESVYPTYQLARLQERQGNLQEALRLYEKVVAEQFDYRDVQGRVAELSERLAATTQVLGGREAVPATAQAAPARYRIIAEVGRGGMGIVYQAEDVVLQRPVAYKVLPDAVREDPKALEDFLREARIAASLHHPNIVTIYDAGQEADAVYIAMEYVEGRSLQDILNDPTALSLLQAVEIFRQACRSLIHAHRQRIVHRDVKPANIMVTRDGTVKLMDFGLAAVVSHASAKVTSVRGTPYYMAPEQITGEACSALSDQYSLGCTFYHMVAGRPPFVEGDVLYRHIHTEPASPRQWNPKIPVWLDAIILRTMVKAPARRFPSVDVLLQEVERCLAVPGATTALGDPAR